MDKYVLFVMTPFLSHLLPTYKLARHFQARGYKIIYVSTLKFEKEITGKGFLFQNSALTGADGSFMKVDQLITHILSLYNPVISLIELSFWNWALFFTGRKQPFMMIQTWPCCNKAPWLEPEGYRIVRNRNLVSYLKNEWAWRKQNTRNKKDLAGGELKDYYQNVVRLAQLNPDSRYISKKDRIGYFRIANTTELVLFPREFDFPRKDDPGTRFIGPFVDTGREERKFNWASLPGGDRPIAFCSMGSMPALFKKRNLFFERMIDAFSGRRDLILIMAVGSGNKSLVERQLPENIFISEYAPQLDILRRAAVFITHGGAGSVREAIYMGVPMIVYPWQTRSDMFGNADRITYHNLGTMGDVENDSASDMMGRVTKVLSDQSIKDSMTRMQSTFRECEGKEEGMVDFILTHK